jgi:D-3-phosphoglycerate dehydrogenase
MLKLAVLDDYRNVTETFADWSVLDGHCERTVFTRPLAADEAVEVLKPFDIVCLMRERMPFSRSLIERLPNLKLIAITGIYNRTLDVAAASDRGIVVSYTERKGTGHFATAELAWALILGVARHIPYEANKMRAGGWQNSIGFTLYGRTLGLLGLGRLGKHMVPIAKGFGMDVVAWSQNLTKEAAAAAGVRRVEKAELFTESDVLSIHVVLGDRTRGLVGANELALMKPTAILVNTARGPIVDEKALIDALREHRIAGAGLDVFDEEPLPDDHPLRSLPMAVLTPHLGYTVREYYETAYGDAVENILSFAKGKPIRILTADRNFSSLQS